MVTFETHYNPATSPLDQFEIRDFFSIKAPILFDIQLSLTNIAFYLCLGTYIVLSLALLANNVRKLVPNH